MTWRASSGRPPRIRASARSRRSASAWPGTASMARFRAAAASAGRPACSSTAARARCSRVSRRGPLQAVLQAGAGPLEVAAEPGRLGRRQQDVGVVGGQLQRAVHVPGVGRRVEQDPVPPPLQVGPGRFAVGGHHLIHDPIGPRGVVEPGPQQARQQDVGVDPAGVVRDRLPDTSRRPWRRPCRRRRTARRIAPARRRRAWPSSGRRGPPRASANRPRPSATRTALRRTSCRSGRACAAFWRAFRACSRPGGSGPAPRAAGRI